MLRPRVKMPSPRVVQVATVAACAVLATAMSLSFHFFSTRRPRLAPSLSDFTMHRAATDWRFGWWDWADQGRYLDGALAWSHGVLDPAHHWYLPGYPLLGALFARLTPVQPFLVPNLLCLVASLVLFSQLACRLAPSMRHAAAVGAVVFMLCALVQPRSRAVWLIPWTSTPEVPLILATLLAFAAFLERPRPSLAFVAALASVAIVGFRPADAACVVLVIGLAMLGALLPQHRLRRDGLRCVLAALAGAALPVILFGAAHLAVYGWAPGGYVIESGRIGFEWRLLPLRWVTIMIDARPLLPNGQGLAERFWWIMPGFAGLATCLLAPGMPARRLNLTVAALVVAELALLLSYRDLQPAGLWRYDNHHYFKWMVPLFGFYAVLLLRALATRRQVLPAAAIGVAVFAGLFMWRADLRGVTPLAVTQEQGVVRIALPDGPPQLGQAIVAPLHGSWPDIYFGRHDLETPGRSVEADSDFKATPRSADTLILPLRNLGTAPATLTLAPGIRLEDGATTAMLARQRIAWGLPCWFNVAPCRPHPPVDASQPP